MKSASLSGTCFIKILDYVSEPVERDTRKFLGNREALVREAFPSRPLTSIVAIIVTRSWWRRWPWDRLTEALRERGYRRWEDGGPLIGIEDLAFVRETLQHLYSSSGKSIWREAAESLEFLEAKLRETGSLRAWSLKVYRAVKGKEGRWKKHPYVEGIKGLGFKGVHNLLRDLGYFDMAPIDIHERRFLLRTGVALRYGPPNRDPLDLRFYLEALRRFCREELRGVKVLGVDLGNAPGMADLAIWYFSCTGESKDCKGVCSAKPRCEVCPVKDCCTYYRLSTLIH